MALVPCLSVAGDCSLCVSYVHTVFKTIDVPVWHIHYPLVVLLSHLVFFFRSVISSVPSAPRRSLFVVVPHRPRLVRLRFRFIRIVSVRITLTIGSSLPIPSPSSFPFRHRTSLGLEGSALKRRVLSRFGPLGWWVEG